jgi:DnaD/phage-associated family protein
MGVCRSRETEDFMNYTVKKKIRGGVFEIPEIIADKHLKFASGDQIKVLLYVLRHTEKNVNAHAVAKFLKMDENDVEDCLQYWVLTNILEDEELASKESAPQKEKAEKPAEPVKFVPGQNKEPETVKSKETVEYTKPTQAEIAARLDESAEIRSLFSDLQSKLGKTIGYDGQATIICLYDHFGLPAQVIFMLVDYCVSIGKTGYSYIEKAGGSWAEQEIDTVEKAAKKIDSLNKVNKFWNKFAISQGLPNGKPTANQVKYISRWLDELKMSFDMICLAYEETLERTGKISLSYTDKILSNWAESGLKTPDDVERAAKDRAAAAKKPAGNPDASYNLDKVKSKDVSGKLTYERKRKQ